MLRVSPRFLSINLNATSLSSRGSHFRSFFPLSPRSFIALQIPLRRHSQSFGEVGTWMHLPRTWSRLRHHRSLGTPRLLSNFGQSSSRPRSCLRIPLQPSPSVGRPRRDQETRRRVRIRGDRGRDGRELRERRGDGVVGYRR